MREGVGLRRPDGGRWIEQTGEHPAPPCVLSHESLVAIVEYPFYRVAAAVDGVGGIGSGTRFFTTGMDCR